ncbi:MAG: heavy metal-binding domain-containing protein [Ginsengibacter sp.]
MKKILILAFAFLSISLGILGQGKAGKIAAPDTSLHKIYSCPMHHDVVSDKPGKCPICSMVLNVSNKEQMKMDVVKAYTCSLHPNVSNSKPGKCPQCGNKLMLSKKEQMKADVMKVYSCPMHPNETSDKSGNCPKCGMAFTKDKKA